MGRAALDSAARAAELKGQVNTTGEKNMVEMTWEIEKIIDVANCLQRTGRSGASTSEIIAAAFVLNRMEFLPDMYSDVLEAWYRLDSAWQGYVLLVKGSYMHMIAQPE